MRDTIRQIVNVLATLVVLIVNYLANALPLNGLSTGDISDRFDVYFVPAGYVFAIWGLIYLALIAFSIYQALPGQRDNARLRRMGYLYALSAVFNITWLFLWHYEVFTFTLVAMVGLLLSLIAIYLILGTGRTEVSRAETWFLRVPFSLYLGWITVATIANATSSLDYLNWNGWGLRPDLWAVIMLIVAAALTTLVSVSRGDIAYVLVITWAFIGIQIKHFDTLSVSVTAGVLAGFVLGTLLRGGPSYTQRRVRTWSPGLPRSGIQERW